jgi:hypothetical protein
MTDLNDLRNSVDFDDDDSPSGDIPVDLDALLAGNEPEKRSDGRFLGMTAGQRAFLFDGSVFERVDFRGGFTHCNGACSFLRQMVFQTELPDGRRYNPAIELNIVGSYSLGCSVKVATPAFSIPSRFHNIGLYSMLRHASIISSYCVLNGCPL